MTTTDRHSLMTTAELATFFNCSKQSLYNKAHNGTPLPPAIKIPGIKGKRYLLADVIDWLVTYRQKVVEPVRRRPGRPRKIV